MFHWLGIPFAVRPLYQKTEFPSLALVIWSVFDVAHYFQMYVLVYF